MSVSDQLHDSEFLEMVLNPIRVCALYKPKFGQGAKDGGLSLAQFQTLYQADAFYNWFGLDNPLMYAAHKAADGMTSVYRQIGIGCERLFRQILIDSLGIPADEANWSYEVEVSDGKTRLLHLDGRVSVAHIQDSSRRQIFDDWMKQSAVKVGVKDHVRDAIDGAVFEVRQGYKSKDAKRQNADVGNAATAYFNALLPCAAILSAQIDGDVLVRYRAAKWMVMTGVEGLNDPFVSTYDFIRDIVGFDLAGFFARNSGTLRREIELVLEALLNAED